MNNEKFISQLFEIEEFMKLKMIFLSLCTFSAIQANAKIFGAHNSLRCNNDFIDCFGQITSLPSLIITSNNVATINPQLVKAVKEALNSQDAPPEIKQQAMQLLLKAADDLIQVTNPN